jgi:hypothetical protein
MMFRNIFYKIQKQLVIYIENLNTRKRMERGGEGGRGGALGKEQIYLAKGGETGNRVFTL